VEPERRLRHISFLVDTNCVNARKQLAPMNRLEEWAEFEIIDLLTAESAQIEMAAGGFNKRTKKAYTFITTLTELSTQEEQAQLNRIKAILNLSNIEAKNQANDVDIVFNSWKYHLPLITNDGDSKSQPKGILGNKLQLDNIGIKVVRPEEAVTIVETALERRDNLAYQWAEFYGKPVPVWVGKDK
jgi:hypothetical protein